MPGLDLELLELSPLGLSIETRRPLRVGDTHRLRLRHKDGTAELNGKVCWRRLLVTSEGRSGGSETHYRAGFSLEGDGLMSAAPAVGRRREDEVVADRRQLVAPCSLSTASERLPEWPSTYAGAPLPERDRDSADAAMVEAVAEIVKKKLLRVVFQPIYDLKLGAVFAYEALARCTAPGLGDLTELYRLAAKAGLVGELGRQHRTQAVQQAPDLPLFINVNPHEFDYPWLVQPDDPIFRHGHHVCVEVTENVPVWRFEQCLSVLGELRARGVQVAVDDLGAGYCNLRYLCDLDPDFVKIDRSLISGVRDATRQYRLLESIVSMCKNLGSRVIGEGVEQADELVALDHAGVDFCQGYLLGRPELPAPKGSWPAFR